MMVTQTTARSIGFFTFVTGFALGAGAGLLLAPQSGARTRRHLQHLGQHVRDKAEDLTQEAKEFVENALDRPACT